MIRAALIALVLAVPAAADAPPLPFDLGGAFRLTDQEGAVRTEVDPDGQAQLLFFGYAHCQQICSAALPMMAEIAALLADRGHAVRPVMITVAPETDTAAVLGPALERHHPDFVGLTGSRRALQAAYDAFGVERKVLFEDPEYGPVYAHGSFIYLLDGQGHVLTLLPPILAPQQAAEIVAVYLTPHG